MIIYLSLEMPAITGYNRGNMKGFILDAQQSSDLFESDHAQPARCNYLQLQIQFDSAIIISFHSDEES